MPALLLLISCRPESIDMTGDVKTGWVVRAGDEGETVEVLVGDTIHIVLGSTSTIGSGWNLAGDLDQEVVRLIRVRAERSRPRPPRGKEVWDLEAVAPGTTDLLLTSSAPERSDDPLEDFSVTIVVADQR